MMISISTLTLILALSSLSICASYERIEAVPKITWDFIIVGGGPGGAVVANRLSENSKFNVLLIEAGPTNEGVLNSVVPGLQGTLALSAYDWNFTTTPQKGLNNRSISLQRGHILGGSTSVNGMVYTRGSSSDFDRYAKVTEDPGWSWDRLQPYIRKHERFEIPVDNRDITGEFNPAVHSTKGKVPITLQNFIHPGSDNITLQASKELGGEFKFNIDMNSGNPIGLGWLQTTIGHNGERSSAAVAYLDNDARSRNNLHIVTNTRVTRVLKTGNGSKLAIRTIEIQSADLTKKTLLTASKEVILSAGAIGTPHILLNSGIGDQKQLRVLNIPSVLHNPNVGRNLQDHPIFGINFGLKPGTIEPGQWDNLFSDPALQGQALGLWKANRTGPYVSLVPVDHLAFVRVPERSNIFKRIPDPSSGQNSPHIEIVLGAIRGTYSIGLQFLTPASRGSVTLRSNDPFDTSLIDLGFLTNEFDIFAIRECFKSAMRFMNAPVFQGKVTGLPAPWANVTTDTEFDNVIRDRVSSGLHPVGTAAMSARNAKSGVVNPDLLVKGVVGLRIVDASVMPYVPCAHTQAAVYIIAERAADIVKEAWK